MDTSTSSITYFARQVSRDHLLSSAALLNTNLHFSPSKRTLGILLKRRAWCTASSLILPTMNRIIQSGLGGVARDLFDLSKFVTRNLFLVSEHAATEPHGEKLLYQDTALVELGTATFNSTRIVPRGYGCAVGSVGIPRET